MGDLEGYYYKLNVTLLSSIGLWPGESTILGQIRKASCGFMMTFTLIIQLIPFITMQYPTTLILHNIPIIIIVMGGVLKYFTFLFQSNHVKEIMELIKYDWSITKDDEESKILMHRAGMGKSYTTMFAKFLYPSLILILSSQYASWFLDIVAPLNGTRSPQYLFTFEAFVDQQKYFHILALTFNVTLCTLITVYLGTESVYMMWLEHQASQYQIYACCIRKAFLEDSAKILDRNARITKIFATALGMHDRAIQLNVYLKKFLWSYAVLLAFGVTSLSVTLYRLSKALESLDNIEDLIMCPLIIIAEFGYMFYLNFAVQEVINSYDNISTATYDTNWYTAPVRAQKMLLFVMLGNMQSLNYKFYGFYQPSMEGFMVLAKVSLSYFITINSMQ